jgi:uncharacterized protein YsxB (DUF464 family)
MICVRFLTAASGDLLGFSIDGHAEYGEHGTDIVCAAVSSAAFMTVNTVTDILHVSAQVLMEEDGSLSLRVTKGDAVQCRKILAGFKLHMIGLEEQYPENISVSYLEV